MTLRPGILHLRVEEKGQPEGKAVKSLTGKPRVAQLVLYQHAAGQNNSNLTSQSASAETDGWELFAKSSSHLSFTTEVVCDIRLQLLWSAESYDTRS